MPYTVTFSADGTGFLFTASGLLEADDLLMEARRRQQDSSRTRQLRYALIDLAAVTEFRVSTRDLRHLAAENRQTAALMPAAHVAFVAPAIHIYGLVRMWEVFAEQTGWVMEVFRDRATAAEWLRRQGSAVED